MVNIYRFLFIDGEFGCYLSMVSSVVYKAKITTDCKTDIDRSIA